MAFKNIKTAEMLAAEAYTAKVKVFEDAIDSLIDDTANARGYGTSTMSPTAACCSYIGYANPYRAEAEAFGVWKASIWPVVFQILTDVQAGTRPEPTAAEVIAELPIMVWP